MKLTGLLIALAAAASTLSGQPAQRVATTLDGADLAALEAIRKDVWVDWFQGDTAALRRVLGPELVAISPGEQHWQSLQESLKGSAEFKASGGRFVSVTFDSSTVHRLGDVVVMFSHYAVAIESGGTPSTLRGRATEVFVRKNGRWVHTSWHLDSAP